ncbi:sugar phosphate isomerase/epimerase family protein [Devosia psychrophila]|jgi:D-psicose/D-tagatose/L-ribulose 3-epimerase|uniref:D-psicose/D-tagatose/L-ribulose 3-epimerase n=1 Tax=Devosia psychrophila TaxID=728005 RepID=A0A0F5PWG0_9HYPH|nr:sugar phosphate isomerase/epimerase family protein [Devosia psychrophila]KKC32731.1 isomerase [Devosia psychrophila]SFC53632.1 D-psicose/D-tagatose/L-ribulose 3-epimerase [Devosia psychrophila]
MQVGINLLCLSGFIDEQHLGQLRRLKELGYDGVEVPVLRGGPEHYAWLGRELDTIGLRRTSTSVIPSIDANPVSSDAAVRKAGIQHLDWALDCAIALGSESVGGPFHAPIGHFTGSGPTPDELRYGAEAHHALAERASTNGIYLSLEHLNRFETYFLNTMAQARTYVHMVDHHAFRIMYDTFHANIEEQNQPRAIAMLGKDMGVLHISENDRGIPGRGHIDFAEIFSAVRGTGYDGWVTLEAFGAGLPELAAATRVWRPLFPDFETLFSESISFIRRGWAEAAP